MCVIARFRLSKVVLLTLFMILWAALVSYECLKTFGPNTKHHSELAKNGNIYTLFALISAVGTAFLIVINIRLVAIVIKANGIAIYEKDGLLICQVGERFAERITNNTTVNIEKFGLAASELIVVQFEIGKRKTFSSGTLDIDAAEVVARINKLIANHTSLDAPGAS